MNKLTPVFMLISVWPVLGFGQDRPVLQAPSEPSTMAEPSDIPKMEPSVPPLLHEDIATALAGDYFLLNSFIDAYEKIRGECEEKYGLVPFVMWKTWDKFEAATLRTIQEQIINQNSDDSQE